MPEEAVVRLIMADGTILDKSQCGYAEKRLWCYLTDVTLAEAYAMFSDPAKTNEIVFEFGTEKRFIRITYTGFTDITTISKKELSIDICMVGENTSYREEEVVE